MTDWLVAVASRRPVEVAADLVERGFNCYQPVFRVKRLVRGEKVWRENLLLGHYVLVQLRKKFVELVGVVLDWGDQFHGIMTTRGVRGILSADGHPLLARAAEVELLRATEKAGYVPPPRYAVIVPGQRVSIIKGVLMDRVARFKSSSGAFDYVDLDGLLGRMTTVKLPSGSVAAVC